MAKKSTNQPAVNVDEASLAHTEAPIVNETRIRVSRTVKLDGRDQETATEEDLIEVRQFATTPAMAVATVPIKISRNFQSVGVEVGVYLPCYREELPEAIEKAYTMAKERVLREIPVIQASLQGIINANNGG